MGVVLIVTSLAYLYAYGPPITRAQWVYEDARVLAQAAEPVHLRPRALAALSIRLTPTPTAVRVGNLIVHGLLVTGLTVFVWARAWPAWVCTSLFVLLLLHPITTETIMYASGRYELVAACGVALAGMAASRASWTVGSLGCVGLGVLLAYGGKETGGITALVLVPFAAWCAGASRRLWRSAAVVSTLLVAGGIWWAGGVSTVVNIGWTALTPTTDVTGYEWAVRQSAAVAYWLVALVDPSWLTPDADVDALSSVIAVAGGVAILGSLVLAYRRCVGFGLFAIAVLPRFFVQTPGSYVNAHQFYTAWLGLVVGVGALCTWHSGRSL